MTQGSNVDAIVRAVLADVLGIDPTRVATFDDDTPLFGALPSSTRWRSPACSPKMEDRLHIIIDDDDIDGEMLASFGALVRFAEHKTLG